MTTGGTGFGVMAIVTAIHRNFITRAEGLARIKKITGFLTNTAQTFHGVFPHWLNGSTGVVISFSSKDDGADLVETSTNGVKNTNTKKSRPIMPAPSL